MYYYISMLTWILVHGNYTQFPATQQMWHWWLQRVVMAKDFSRRLVKREIELPSFKVFAWYNSYYWMCIFLVRIGSASWLVMSCYFQLIEFPSWVCYWFCAGHKDSEFPSWVCYWFFWVCDWISIVIERFNLL